jgi:hypothetical protein
MPKLLLFAACEQVITDVTNTLSLMKLLQEITVNLPAGVPSPPGNAGSPMQWSVVSIFAQQPGDSTKRFEHYVTLTTSGGQILVQTPISLFELKTDQHRIIGQVMGFPIGYADTLQLKCFLREKGNTNWNECGSYPIKVIWSSGSQAVH